LSDSSDPLPANQHDRLDEIATRWSLLRVAPEDSAICSVEARGALVLRYHAAIRGYVGAILRDPYQADELAQEVMLRMLKGDFGQATPQRGRFRDLLKASIRNMIRSHWRKQQRRTGADLEVDELPDTEGMLETLDADDTQWIANWQRSVLDHTWRRLGSHQQSNGGVAYTVLKLRADHPEEDSRQLARRLSDAVGKSFNPPATRQQLRRSRLRFAQLLVEEVARGLPEVTPERIEEELIDLGLMPYVGDFLPDDWREQGQLRDDAQE
jgi:RNA polymerase sigma factor (sigma-70 family)